MLSWIFPSLCRLCTRSCASDVRFCRGCAQAFIFLDPRHRCPYCFEQQPIRPCSACHAALRSVPMAICWDNHHAVEGLLSLVAKGHETKLAAHSLLLQWHRMNWAVPDYIVPLPTRRDTTYIQYYARLMGVPYFEGVGKLPGFLPQRALPFPQRLRDLPFAASARLAGKHVLLVDDEIVTGSTQRGAIQALMQSQCRTVECLYLARSPLFSPTQEESDAADGRSSSNMR